ncbi:hypothetical protein JK635_17475 [Neobacillus sp. YIM B02564]|uniref:Uncharacterized protein n=1 Tax=Neobacillus paridis TaxID=2803862 RepID=A0ABS1TRP2_9BACI|nr:hypothetical protein [Neobacillus paridis]
MARRDAEAAEDEAYWEKCAREQHEISLKIANQRILELSAERDAYRDLAMAMLQELGEPNPVLTVVENRDARKAYFEERKQKSIDATLAANPNLRFL